MFRYVGENYSNAQEAMEETMSSFYNQSCAWCPLSKPAVGQLVAVRGEDGGEVTRAQVIELISPDKVKVMLVELLNQDLCSWFLIRSESESEPFASCVFLITRCIIWTMDFL